MELSVRLFGLSTWSILVPEALMGVATVGVLYLTVRRVAGPAPGCSPARSLALTPVAVLMFRFDNPDALLVLLMTLRRLRDCPGPSRRPARAGWSASACWSGWPS